MPAQPVKAAQIIAIWQKHNRSNFIEKTCTHPHSGVAEFVIMAVKAICFRPLAPKKHPPTP
jgi:hypothetical protein